MRKTLLFSFVLSTALLAHPPGLNAAADQRVKARIGVDRQRVKVGEAVHFSATASLAGKGAELVAAFWDFDDLDQVGVDALGDSVSHVYNHTGAYSVRLTVENNIGERDQATAFVEVLPDTDQGPLITDNFAGGKTGVFFASPETFAFRLEWGGQFYFRLDNCRNMPVSLKIEGYGPNRLQLPSVTPYSDDYSFDSLFTLMMNSDYLEPDWQPLSGAKYAYDENSATLTVNFTPDRQPLYLACASPYTPARLEALLDRWEDRPEFAWRTIGLSAESRPIYAITLTDQKSENKDKKSVWIIGTQHAYEMAGPSVCEGLISTLLEDSDSARSMLRDYVFNLVPMVNPDGVTHGGYRYNMHNVDLNRNWDNQAPNPWDRTISEPEVASVKRALRDWVDSGGGLEMFFDFHCLTAIAGDLLLIKAQPDSIPEPIKAAEDRFAREFFAKKYVLRISESDFIGSSDSWVSHEYAADTGVLSFTSEHSLGWVTRAGGKPFRSTPAFWRELGGYYVWTIRNYFASAK